MGKENKEEARKNIEDFFKDLKDKTPKEIKKIKTLAMSFNIKLGDKRKKFCPKCYSTKLKFRKIKNGTKIVECENCSNLMRWKIK